LCFSAGGTTVPPDKAASLFRPSQKGIVKMRRNRHLVRFALTLALTLACAGPALAQAPSSASSLSGRVTDPRGAGLPFASVTLYARDRSAAARVATTTDAEGAYRFERLAPGEYVLEAGAEGFTRARARVVRVARGSAQPSIDIALEVAGVSEEVVVTASDAPQTADEVSKAVDVVGRAEVEARGEFAIAEALRTVPGLRVQQLGGPGSFVSIKTRGLRNQDTAVLIDGLRFRDVTAPQGDASGFLGDLVVTGASRVEVLRGSGSSIYGTNAIGGVVNLVTEEGGGPFHGQLLAEGGGLGFARARAQVAGGAGRAARLIYSASVSHLNVSRGVDGDDAARNSSGQGRAVLRLSPKATLSARLYAADTFLQLNENPLAIGALPAAGVVEARTLSSAELRRFEQGASLSSLDTSGATLLPATNDADNSRAGRFLSGAVTLAGRPAEDFGYAVTYHGLATRNRFSEGPATPGGPFDFLFFDPAGSTRNDFDGSTHTVNARTDFRLGPLGSLTAGYEFEHESFRNDSFGVTRADDSSVRVDERSHTFFIQDQLRLLDERLQLSAAFRAQFFSLTEPRFTPSADAPYAGFGAASPPNAYTGDGSIAYFVASSGTKLRAHVGNGYRQPSLFERFGSFLCTFCGGPPVFSPLGDPRLAPERSVAFDAGIDQTVASERVRLSATYFYTRLQEVVGFDLLPPGDPFGRTFSGYLNTGGGLARGLELSARLAPARTLDLFASYTYTNSDQRRPQVAGVLRSFAVPDHQFSLVATERIGRRLLLNFDFTASSDYLAPIFDPVSFQSRAFRFSGLVKGDLGASYTWPLSETRSLRFFGQVENIFDRDYYESGFRTPGRTGRAGAALNF
jgi:iron complex outermembrane receptor protein